MCAHSPTHVRVREASPGKHRASSEVALCTKYAKESLRRCSVGMTCAALYSRKLLAATHPGGKLLRAKVNTILRFLQMTSAKDTYEELDAAPCCSEQNYLPLS